ncbi:uncharacterized protein CC84DRAFT_407450 [Paraphaeosphaeria sporulosa]|uniref:Uncharacterized protein n=1 Tax=Paraphaeosphaeria sporulosa TaxID=1460663 RepID=A0A177BVJ6_9PLEO|nr:uncharacterized protein CC84DRAFT_407450 [Paraphaeosphaeria sporulosa]OAF99503.1 hypothetical protein CC84DRAFT_407450 [Paraphaeosphaeria sporulosa]
MPCNATRPRSRLHIHHHFSLSSVCLFLHGVLPARVGMIEHLFFSHVLRRLLHVAALPRVAFLRRSTYWVPVGATIPFRFLSSSVRVMSCYLQNSLLLFTRKLLSRILRTQYGSVLHGRCLNESGYDIPRLVGPSLHMASNSVSIPSVVVCPVEGGENFI